MKQFLIIGNQNAITYKEIFPLIKDNKMWMGVNSNKTMEFAIPDSYEKWNQIEDGVKIGKVPAISWFTNIEHAKRNLPLDLYKTYSNEYYPKYDNYDAIEVSKTVDIPMDYDGVMGVPITFLDKYNPYQFEIVGIGIANLGLSIGIRGYLPEHREYRKNIEHKGVVDGDLYYLDNNGHPKVPYARILIRHKK